MVTETLGILNSPTEMVVGKRAVFKRITEQLIALPGLQGYTHTTISEMVNNTGNMSLGEHVKMFEKRIWLRRERKKKSGQMRLRIPKMTND